MHGLLASATGNYAAPTCFTIAIILDVITLLVAQLLVPLLFLAHLLQVVPVIVLHDWIPVDLLAVSPWINQMSMLIAFELSLFLNIQGHLVVYLFQLIFV